MDPRFRRNDKARYRRQRGQKNADCCPSVGIIVEGREIVVEGLPQKMHARNGGTLEDPRFANVHVEIRWPD